MEAARLEQGAGSRSRSRAGERPELGEASGRDPRRRYLYPADITGPSCSGTAGGCWGGRPTAPAPQCSPAGTAGPWPPHGPLVAHSPSWAPPGTPKPPVGVTAPRVPLCSAPPWAMSPGEQGEDRGAADGDPPRSPMGCSAPPQGCPCRQMMWGGRKGAQPFAPSLALLEPRPHVPVGTLPKLALGTPKCPQAPQNVPISTLTCPMARGPGSAPCLGPDNSDPPRGPAPQRGGHRGPFGGGNVGGPALSVLGPTPPGRPPLSDTEGSGVGPGTRGEVLSDPEQVPGCRALGGGDISGSRPRHIPEAAGTQPK